MKKDSYVICANCRRFKAEDRYHGECRAKFVATVELGVARSKPLRVRWNTDARNCECFEARL